METYTLIKRCGSCNTYKTLDSFYNNKNNKDGKCYRCKDCDSKARKKYYRENETSKDKRLERLRKHRYKNYGITQKDYDELFKKQNNSCAICSSKDTRSPSKYFSVDHCHITGKVRGLLCNQCNRGLGFLGDTKESLYKAYMYLRNQKH